MLNPTEHLRASLKAVLSDPELNPTALISRCDDFSVFSDVRHLFNTFIDAAATCGQLTREHCDAAINFILQLIDLQEGGEASDALKIAFTIMAGKRYFYEHRAEYISETCDRAIARNQELGREVSDLTGQVTMLRAQLAALTNPDPDPS